MPKMKTKSGVKKRFKITGSGKTCRWASREAPRHDQRTPKFIRNAGGGGVVLKMAMRASSRNLRPMGLTDRAKIVTLELGDNQCHV